MIALVFPVGYVRHPQFSAMNNRKFAHTVEYKYLFRWMSQVLPCKSSPLINDTLKR